MISLDKTYRTECGHEVKLYAIYKDQIYGIHGAVKGNGVWSQTCWDSDGKCKNFAPNFDLIEVKPKRTLDVWLNVYEDGFAFPLSSKKVADKAAAEGRIACIACIHIVHEYEEGEGL